MTIKYHFYQVISSRTDFNNKISPFSYFGKEDILLFGSI